MVLCKHFQQGNCRFGSKCNFEHIDIKQLVKSDVEGAINGKQYLFSCYGPFKDKACVPNFIQDQSFEEMRLLCYEAKQKNYFEQFHQQLQMQALDAMNKMKALVQPSYEILNMLTMIYDTPVGNGNQPVATNNANPFGLNSSTTNNTNAGSIFGKSNLSNNNAGMFGGGTATNNMQTAGGIFGGQNTFGAQQQQQQPQQSSIFGQASQPQQTTGSIFGGGMTKPSIFGQQPPAQNTAGSGFGLFAQAANTQNTSVFGQPPSFRQSQQMQAQQQQQQPQQQGAGIFSQNAFGNQAPNVNPFGQSQPQQQSQNMFAQPNTMMPAQPNTMMPAQPNTMMPAQPNTMMPAQPNTMMPAQPQQQNNTNLFAQASQQQQTQPSGGFFQQTSNMSTGNMQQPQHQQQHPFAQSQQTTSAPQTTSQTAGLPQNPSSIYSRIEDLTAEQIAAFKAEIFEPGKLPLVPPPIEMINI